MDLSLDDIVRLRKPHPCGGYEWCVVRLGADIAAKCTTCGRRVMMPRSKFERQVKQIVRRSGEIEIIMEVVRHRSPLMGVRLRDYNRLGIGDLMGRRVSSAKPILGEAALLHGIGDWGLDGPPSVLGGAHLGRSCASPWD